ncbi:MAG: hypothetical protein WAZ27_04690 [Minisyncoccia bacterium]
MLENIRLVFSAIWMVSLGCLFASATVFIFTWGGFAPYFYWSAGTWMISTIVVVVSSLDA